MDPAVIDLSRLQFALTALYHFLFVPLTLGLSFMLGVRVVATVDETTELGGRPARVWGWSYATLQGHLEMGRLDYAVVHRAGGVQKHGDSRVHASLSYIF